MQPGYAVHIYDIHIVYVGAWLVCGVCGCMVCVGVCGCMVCVVCVGAWCVWVHGVCGCMVCLMREVGCSVKRCTYLVHEIYSVDLHVLLLKKFF